MLDLQLHLVDHIVVERARGGAENRQFRARTSWFIIFGRKWVNFRHLFGAEKLRFRHVGPCACVCCVEMEIEDRILLEKSNERHPYYKQRGGLGGAEGSSVNKLALVIKYGIYAGFVF